jgi:uncharacterized Zn finger protein (UPF0148 family)
MTLNFDSSSIEITCPKCGKELKETLGRLKRTGHIVCPTCGRQLVDMHKVRNVELAINKKLAQLGKTIKIKR